MRIWTLLVIVVGVVGIVMACKVSAQAIPDDPLAPVRCYQQADAKSLAGDSIIQLCSGALSDSPSRCFATALEEFTDLSEQQILQLCTGATDMQPIACAAHLRAGNDVTEQQLVEFCGTRCGLGPPPTQVNNSQCMSLAMTTAGLALQTAAQLCSGARSAGPARCFIVGSSTLTQVASSKLVDMCSESRRCQYTTAPTAGY